MATITVGGLATGLDTNQIVDELVRLQRIPIDLLNDQRDDVEATKSDFGTIDAKLVTLKSALDELRTASDFLAKAASSSDTDVLTASATSSATAGTTTVTVSQLARVSIASSGTGVSATTDTVASGSGSFIFKVGSGSNQTVSLTASTTLEDLRDAINDLDAGVTASTVNVGTAASPDYRLQIVSDSTGTSNDITIVQDDTDISITTTQAALNAQFTVSGLTPTITRESNTVGDVIPGVTLTLKSTGSSTVTVSNDTAAIEANAQAFVDAFNDVIQFIDSESDLTLDAENDEIIADPLALDSTSRRIDSRLHDIVSQSVSGLSGTFNQLAQIGITTQRDGTLELDSAKFQDKLASYPDDVKALFAGDGTVDGMADTLYDIVNSYTQYGGVIDKREDGLQDRIDDLTDRIEDAERFLADFEEDLRNTFTALEITVSQLQSQSNYLVSQLSSLLGTSS